MHREQRITRDAAVAFMAQLRLAFQSGAERSTVRLLGTEIVLEKASDHGFTARAPDQPPSPNDRLYPPMDSRPGWYPDGMPFEPDEPVSVSRPDPGSTALMWFAPRDQELTFASLVDQTLADDWAPRSDPDPLEGVERRLYGKDGAVRTLTKYPDGMISLHQRRGR